MLIEIIQTILSYIYGIYGAIGGMVYEFYVSQSRAILDVIHTVFLTSFDYLLYITIVLAGFYMFMAFAILLKKKRKAYDLEEGAEPFITVQIPTYNELAAIRCAKRCLDSNYPTEKMQILIGDDSSDASVSKRIGAFAKQHPEVKVTRRGNNEGYKPGNLNHMLKYTKGEFIVIFDSDFLPEKDFLRRIIAPFMHDKSLSVVQARWNLDNFTQNINSVLGGAISLICHNVALPFISWYGGNSFLCGSAEAIRKEDLIKAGGWTAGSLTEDIECSLRLIKEGKKLLYLEDLECKCEAPHTASDLCKQQMRWAYGVISSFKLHFFSILRSKKTLPKDKISIVIFASGYMFSFLLLGLTVVGTLSVISAPIEPIKWGVFLAETFKNILVTSGFIVTSIVALGIGNKLREVPRMIIGSLSVGLVVTFFVNVGIFKAIFGRPMKWFMLSKNGNQI